MAPRTLGYWTTTGLFCAVLAFSGANHLFHSAFIVEAMQGLGYPIYVSTILGVAKLAGVAVLLAPGLPLLKEWAYAGFAFNLLGAAASHAFAGEPLAASLPPLAVLLLAAASYLLRPSERRLLAAPGLSARAASGAPATSTGPL